MSLIPPKRVLRTLSRLAFAWCGFALLASAGCRTLSDPEVKEYPFPTNVYVGEPGRPFQALGRVRTKVEWTSLNSTEDEDKLCLNYYNKALFDLYMRARERGADAVVGARSVTFQMDGKVEAHRSPECSDDGQTGQILAEGVAVKWKPFEVDLPVRKGRLRAKKRVSGAKTPILDTAAQSTDGTSAKSSKGSSSKKKKRVPPTAQPSVGADADLFGTNSQVTAPLPKVRRVKKHVEPTSEDSPADETKSGANPGSPLFPSFGSGG